MAAMTESEGLVAISNIVNRHEAEIRELKRQVAARDALIGSFVERLQKLEANEELPIVPAPDVSLTRPRPAGAY